MLSLFKTRYWSLIAVMFIVGAICFFNLSPFYVHIFSLGNESLIVCYKKMFDATEVSFGKTFFFLVVSLFLGASIQGFSSVFWGYIRSKNFFEKRIIFRSVVKLFQYIYQSPQIRQSIEESEGKYPLPGSKNYAKMELFIAKNVNRLEYLEWERFLHFFYEYIGYVFLISSFHYATYNTIGMILTRLNMLTIDFEFNLFIGLFLMIFNFIISFIFIRFSQEHRTAHRQALTSVWSEISKTNVSNSVGNE